MNRWRTETGTGEGAALAQMLHLRIVAPADLASDAERMLLEARSAVNVVRLEGAARKPDGDLILCDVVRRDASLIIEDLRELGVPNQGTIAVELVDTELSATAARAARAAGPHSGAIVWEEVEAETSESAELSPGYVGFMVLATLIAAVGIVLDEPILIVAAMILGPELGPIVGACVALVERRTELVRRSVTALLVGFPIGIVAAALATLLFRWTDLVADELPASERPLTEFIAHPDELSVIVALAAGVAAALTLTSAKLSPLVGVVVSVVTIPAAANTGVAAAFGNWGELLGAQAQLWLNLVAVIVAGTGTLLIQRRAYLTRLRYRRRQSRPADDGRADR